MDLTKLSGAARGRWFDPANGTYLEMVGSPSRNSGTRNFTPPGRNNSGEGDWVLALEVQAATTKTH